MVLILQMASTGFRENVLPNFAAVGTASHFLDRKVMFTGNKNKVLQTKLQHFSVNFKVALY